VSEEKHKLHGRWMNTNKKVGPEDRPILRTSFVDLDNANIGDRLGLVPYGNGFVDGIIRAFQQDLHLSLRPDDLWLAIIVQFSFYVNGHAEELRHIFVSHKDKKTIAVDMTPATLQTASIDLLCEKFVAGMRKHITDAGMVEWLLPKFSTTSATDQTVAAMVLMSTMKSYFEYVVAMGCGFPSVTLEGEKKDWKNLLERLYRFARYGDEPAEWITYLSQVLENIIASFDKPEDDETITFWMQACHAAGADGSGCIETLSGWLTAFCFWDAEGKRIHNFTDEQLAAGPRGNGIDRQRLILDGVAFPIIARSAIPKAVSDVPVLVNDMETKQRFHTTIVAGSVGMEGVQTDNNPESRIQAFRPRSGWWMLLDKAEPLE
jgi:hypothetical protein